MSTARDMYILMIDGQDVAEFKTSRSGKNAFKLADAVLRFANVDMTKHVMVLRWEYKRV